MGLRRSRRRACFEPEGQGPVLESNRDRPAVFETSEQDFVGERVPHLGLDHTRVPNATMLADYELSNLGSRTLSADDRAGICSVYSPMTDGELVCPGSTGPHHGFSRECGTSAHADASCLSLAGAAPARGSAGLPWLGLGLLAWFRLRRR